MLSDFSNETTPKLLNEAEAAELLGFSVRCMQNWRFRGGGPSYVRVSKRAIRYRQSDLEKWIEERVVLNTADRNSLGNQYYK